MKAVILAGGTGSRLAEETDLKPKPLVEIGDHPILWHICKIYESAGVHDFVIAGGYKREAIAEYFAGFRLRESDSVFDLAAGTVEHLPRDDVPSWTVAVVDTGGSTATGGRLRKVRGWLSGESTFLMTYGDGVGDIDIRSVIEFHRSRGKLCTVTVVRPAARFGTVILENDSVVEFAEKSPAHEGWINGGFFVVEQEALDLVDDDSTSWEGSPMEQLARRGELAAFRHDGFWHPMDTLRDKRFLNELWNTGKAPWKTW